MSKYQGKNVSVVRKAQQGDQGFDASKDQTLIRLEDGSQKVVPSNDVTE